MSRTPRRTRLRTLLATTLLASACLLALPTESVAQDTRPKAPPPAKSGDPPKVKNMLMLVVILGVALGVHAIPSKRGHQD